MKKKRKDKKNFDLVFSKKLQNFYDQEYEDYLNNFNKSRHIALEIAAKDYDNIPDNQRKKEVKIKEDQNNLLNKYNKSELYQKKINKKLRDDYKYAIELDKLINVDVHNVIISKNKKTSKNNTNNNKNQTIKKTNLYNFIPRVNKNMINFIQKISDKEYTFGVHDAGAGGDCLFYSISAGITQALFSPSIYQNRTYSVQELRNIVADEILNWDLDKFKTNLEVFKALEETDDWDDEWSPEEICSRKHLAKQFRQMGNNHWGTDFDIDIISDKLNIGIIVFRSGFNLAELYCFVKDEQKKKRKKYFILIYNIDDYHYKLAGLKHKEGSYFQSVFNLEEIPHFLKNEYENKCKTKLY